MSFDLPPDEDPITAGEAIKLYREWSEIYRRIQKNGEGGRPKEVGSTGSEAQGATGEHRDP